MTRPPIIPRPCWHDRSAPAAWALAGHNILYLELTHRSRLAAHISGVGSNTIADVCYAETSLMYTGPATFVQYGVRWLAAIYVVIGLLGFLPIETLNPTHHNAIDARYLLHLVAINAPHNIFHLAIGASGLWASRTPVGARRWGLIAGTVLVVLFFVGMGQSALEAFPKDQLLFELIPLNSPGHVLHVVSGGIALYLGIAQSGG